MSLSKSSQKKNGQFYDANKNINFYVPEADDDDSLLLLTLGWILTDKRTKQTDGENGGGADPADKINDIMEWEWNNHKMCHKDDISKYFWEY